MACEPRFAVIKFKEAGNLPLSVASFLQWIAIYIILSWAIYIVYRAGQLYNGPIFTMIIGAYFSAYAVRDMGWPFGLALLGAVGLGAFCAFLPALRLGRVPAFTTAIATIALIFIVQTIIMNLDFLGGTSGLFPIPKVGYLLPLSYVALAIIGFLIYRLDHSRLGRAMEVGFVDPDVAFSLGVDFYKVRVYLQVASGAMGALAGVMYGFSVSAIQPQVFGISYLLVLYVFLFVGGHTTMWGVVVVTPILWALTVFLPGTIAVWKNIIYGSLLIIVLILRPNGVIDKKVLRAISTKSRDWLGQLRGLRKPNVVT